MSDIFNRPLVLDKKSKSSHLINFSGEGNYFLDKIFRVVYISLLFLYNFVMFIYSINARLVENGEYNQAVLYVLGSFFVVVFIGIFLLSFSRNLQNLACAFFTMIFVVIFFHQFALFDVNNFIKDWINEYAKWLSFICIVPSSWFVGIGLGISVFFLFRHRFCIIFITIVLLVTSVLGIVKSEKLESDKRNYITIKELRRNIGLTRDTNIVYFMIPKLPSYQFFNNIKDTNFRELRNLLIGFFAVNNFEIYPNAFVENKGEMENVVDIFNFVDYTSSSSQDRGYSEYINNWNFIHGGFDILSLDENLLYSFLEQEGYGMSVYAMPGFNMCLKGGVISADRCVVKGYKTVSIYDKNRSLEKNIYTLLTEWLLNMKEGALRVVARSLYKKSTISDYKVTAENRRVSLEGAVGVFDVLTKHFLRDANGQVYMVYVDLPGDMYIYDEYCNVKPREEWISLKDNSLSYVGVDEKRKAYVDQTKCLLGRLQEFIDDIEESDKAEKTDIYVQGVSTLKELSTMSAGDYSNFVNDKLVSLGIRKHKKAKFLINANICLASDFTKTLIRNEDFCYTVNNMSFGDIRSKSLKQNLINNAVLRGGKITSIAINYNDWYETYKNGSLRYLEKHRNKQIDITDENNKKDLEKKQIKRALENDDLFDDASDSSANKNIYLPDSNLVFDIEVENMPTKENNKVVPMIEENNFDKEIEELQDEKIEEVIDKKEILGVLNSLEELAPEDTENAKKIIENVGKGGLGGIMDFLPKD